MKNKMFIFLLLLIVAALAFFFYKSRGGMIPAAKSSALEQAYAPAAAEQTAAEEPQYEPPRIVTPQEEPITGSPRPVIPAYLDVDDNPSAPREVPVISAGPVESAPAARKDAAPQLASAECADYGLKLRSCEVYDCFYTFPMTGETLRRKIFGRAGNVCQVKESLPGGGVSKCSYPVDNLSVIADFLEKSMASESISTSVSFSGGVQEQEVMFDDGTVSGNPLANVYADGTCEIIH